MTLADVRLVVDVVAGMAKFGGQVVLDASFRGVGRLELEGYGGTGRDEEVKVVRRGTALVHGRQCHTNHRFLDRQLDVGLGEEL